ncbi:MAG TPA: hypothetical protein VME18_13930 [Acidobacteriaceae bacterium]|nr:hypothetical protein [Acidobacteriaceae bacterium]
MRVRALLGIAILGTMLAAVGCHVQVDKGNNGEDKNVRIETPLGGLQVRSDQTTAADLGLPVYPGAQAAQDNGGDKSADVRMGFGEWQMRVEVVTYETSDAQSRVIAFYKKAMGRFGDVLSCQGNQAVGTPTVTGEGLTCSESGTSHVQVNGVNVDDENDFTLRAGSKHHQHIFVLKSSGQGTRFSLVDLELPAGTKGDSGNSD